MQVPKQYQGEVKNILKNILGELNDTEYQSILSRLFWRDYLGGEYIFKQNSLDDKVYIVVHGRIKVIRNIRGEKTVIKELSKGEIVGEMSLLSENPRNADVMAIRDCHLISLSRSDFNKIAEDHPKLGLYVSKLLFQRLKPDLQSRNPRHIKHISVISASPKINRRDFISKLEVRRKDKKIFVINQELALEKGYTKGKGTNQNFVSYCEKLELQNDLVIYDSNPKPDSWSSFCFRQSDEIIILIDPRNTSFLAYALNQLENAYWGDISFVILHESENAQPKNTNTLINKYPYTRFFHVRGNKTKDIDRVFRYLFDETTGLVLAGGGAPGTAHLGVWKAIRELEIPIDMIGGTSMGAFLGGVMAFDWDFETIFKIGREIAYSRPASDINPIPYSSMLIGKNLNKVLRKYYEAFYFEDCIIPFYCTSANLTAAKLCIHSKGNLFTAIRASGSLPGIVPPVPIEGDWHVDGGIFDNFPVDEMVLRGMNKIIGVSFLSETNNKTEHVKIPSFWTQIRHGLRKTTRELKVPSMIESIMQSTTVNSHQRQLLSGKKVDQLICPDINSFGLLDWKSFDKAVERGYEEAMKILSP